MVHIQVAFEYGPGQIKSVKSDQKIWSEYPKTLDSSVNFKIWSNLWSGDGIFLKHTFSSTSSPVASTVFIGKHWGWVVLILVLLSAGRSAWSSCHLCGETEQHFGWERCHDKHLATIPSKIPETAHFIRDAQPMLSMSAAHMSLGLGLHVNSL